MNMVKENKNGQQMNTTILFKVFTKWMLSMNEFDSYQKKKKKKAKNSIVML